MKSTRWSASGAVVLRWCVRAVVALVIGVGLAVGGSTVALADSGTPLDLDMYCYLTKPTDPSGTNNFTYVYKGSEVRNGEPRCKYLESSAGDIGGFPSYTALPRTFVRDWGTGCRMTYGPQAWAQRDPLVLRNPGAKCHNVDWGFYERTMSEIVGSTK